MTPDQIEALRAQANRPKAEAWITTEKRTMDDGQELSVQTRPKAGDEIAGVVVGKSIGTSKYLDPRTKAYKRYPIIEIEDGDGKRWVIFGHGVFLSDLAAVEIGDLVIVLYEGLGEAKKGQKPPKVYKTAALRDGAPVRLSNESLTSGDAPSSVPPLNPDDPFDLGQDEPF